MDSPEQITPELFLSGDGPIAHALDGYESRPQQIEMGQRVADAMGDAKHLIIEAGTGVGKSFAYLTAAILHAKKHGQKVVISTYTISLQEQLIRKDIPFLKEVSGIDFSAVLVKGRQNYLCPRRLRQAQKRQASLFDTAEESLQLQDLFDFSMETKDGTLSDLPFSPNYDVWEMVCSDESICQGRVCNRNTDCFYQKARRRVYNADLIITNHALLFSDLAVRQQGGSILPDYKHVIIDEAHIMEDVASKHFGLRLSNSQIRFLLTRIFNPRTRKGALAPHVDETLLDLLDQTHVASTDFFDELLAFTEQQEAQGKNGRVDRPDLFSNLLVPPLKKLAQHLYQISERCTDEQDQLEIHHYSQRCDAFTCELEIFQQQMVNGSVYWIENQKKRNGNRITLCASPLHAGESLKRALFDPMQSVIMTSATLSTGNHLSEQTPHGNHGFEFFTSRLGLEQFDFLQLGSPFNYQEQTKVYIETTLPEPTLQKEAYLPEAVKAIKKYLLQTEGKALLLFTSYGQLRQIASEIRSFCREHDFDLLEQGGNKGRYILLNEFKEKTNSILLGTDSFWQGIDVSGESLSNVIIVKLPFAVPDSPLLQARLEKIRRDGGNPFFDYQLPQATLKFKQGFGRLIRKQTDNGIVVILDPRIVTKRYGQQFLKAIPSCPIEYVN